MNHHKLPQEKRTHPFISVVLITAVLGLLAAIAIPHYVRARTTMSMNSCIYYQMWIETAKRRWAAENHKPSDAVPTDAQLLTYMRKVTPMWAGRKHVADLPSQLSNVSNICSPYAVGSVTTPIQCRSIEYHRWDEEAYRMHYALDQR